MKNLPNYLSIFRICLVPFFVLAYFKDAHGLKLIAAGIYAVAFVTDFLDGYLARKNNWISNAGKFLDPFGDKLMTAAVLVCITIDKIIPVPIVAIYFIKEILMGIGGLVIHKIAKLSMPPSNILGKLSTGVFFVTCLILLVYRDIPYVVAVTLVSIAIAIMLLAFVSYIFTYAKIMKNRVKTTE